MLLKSPHTNPSLLIPIAVLSNDIVLGKFEFSSDFNLNGILSLIDLKFLLQNAIHFSFNSSIASVFELLSSPPPIAENNSFNSFSFFGSKFNSLDSNNFTISSSDIIFSDTTCLALINSSNKLTISSFKMYSLRCIIDIFLHIILYIILLIFPCLYDF